MKKEVKKPAAKEDTRLSYSSGQLLEGCTQKYYWKKVAAKPQDSGQDQTPFNVGKAFHSLMEWTRHSRPPTFEEVKKAAKQNHVMTYYAQLHVMALRHLQMHKKTNDECVATEFEVTHRDTFVGYVDAILREKKGGWWIADEKTARNISDLTIARLKTNTQLNLYANFASEFAKMFGLAPAKFKGIRYRVTEKPQSAPKAGEEYKMYLKRAIVTIDAWDVKVPKDALDPAAAFRKHLSLHTLSMKLRSGEVQPQKNFAFCDTYFKPCEYWSQCHGSEYVKGAHHGLEIIKA